MKKLLTTLFLFTGLAFGQAIRYDTTVSQLTFNNLLTPPSNATAAVYLYPGAGSSCSAGGCTLATTYTGDTAAVACSTSLQLTASTSAACASAVGNSGNIGFWALPGKYQWCITATGLGTQCTNVNLSNDPTATATFTGVQTFSAAVNLNGGGALVGTFTGTPTFSGNVIFSANPNFTGSPTFNTGTPAFNNGASLAGTFSGSPTLSGNPNFTGAPVFVQEQVTEGTAVAAVAGKDVCYGDSAAHSLKCSYNNGTFFTVPQSIGTGTATMTVAAIGAGTCGTTVTVAATGVATTDVVEFSFNAAPAANPAQLVVSAWPTANNVNFQYCNPSAGSITPNAATLNWRVSR